MHFEKLLKKDLSLCLRQGRFAFFLAGAILAFAFNAVYFSLDYEKKQTAYSESRDNIYAQLNPNNINYIQPPSPLEFFTGGSGNGYPDTLRFKDGVLDFINSSKLYRSLVSPYIDLSLESIVVYFLSFFAVLLGQNLIHTERDRRLLPLIFSNAVGRLKFILSKVFTANIVVGGMLLLGLIFCLTLLYIYKCIPLNVSCGFYLLIFSGTTLLFLNFYFLLGILCALLIRDLTRSMIVLLIIWVALNVGCPLLFEHQANKLSQQRSVTEVQNKQKQSDLEFRKLSSAVTEPFWEKFNAGKMTPEFYNEIQTKYRKLAKETAKKYQRVWFQGQDDEYRELALLYRRFMVIPAVNYSILNSWGTGAGFFPFYAVFQHRSFFEDQLVLFSEKKSVELKDRIKPNGYISCIDKKTGQEYKLVYSFDYSRARLHPHELPDLKLEIYRDNRIFVMSLLLMIGVVFGLLFAVCVTFLKMDLRR